MLVTVANAAVPDRFWQHRRLERCRCGVCVDCGACREVLDTVDEKSASIAVTGKRPRLNH